MKVGEVIKMEKKCNEVEKSKEKKVFSNLEREIKKIES